MANDIPKEYCEKCEKKLVYRAGVIDGVFYCIPCYREEKELQKK